MIESATNTIPEREISPLDFELVLSSRSPDYRDFHQKELKMTNQILTQTVSFYGSNILTLKLDDVIYTAVKPLVESIGLDWTGQAVKLKGNKEKFGCRDISIPTKGGVQSMICMPLKKLNGWLFSINPEKVRPDLKEKVIQYQEECFEALYNYWHFGKAERKTTVDDRAGLRNAVNMLVSKKGLLYSDAYNLVHQYMNVESIEDIPADKLQTAVEYVHKIVLEGELITNSELSDREKKFSFEFTEYELQSLAWSLFVLMKNADTFKIIIPAMEALKSNLVPTVYSQGYDYHYTIKEMHAIVSKLTAQFDIDPDTNWRVLKHIRNFDPRAKCYLNL